MAGKKSIHFQDCFEGNYIGVNFGIKEDLTNNLPDNWKEFNKNYIPKYLRK